MKHKISFTLIICAILLLTSCGRRKGSSITINTKSNIEGSLKDYLQVVPNNYEVSPDGDLKIKIKAIKAMSEADMYDKKILVSASLLNSKGMPVSGIDEFKIEYADESKLIELLKRGTGEEIINLKNYYHNQLEQYGSDVEGVAISSIVREKEWGEGKATPKQEQAVTTAPSDGEGDWNKILTDYSDMVDQYIVLLKKAKNNDASAIAEYPGILEKAQTLDDELQKAKGYNRLNTEQLQKLVNLEFKMANAMIDLQKDLPKQN